MSAPHKRGFCWSNIATGLYSFAQSKLVATRLPN